MNASQELQPIESLKLEELQEAVVRHQDSMESWKLQNSSFRLIREKDGKIWGIVPCEKLESVSELSLFEDAQATPYALKVDVLIGKNLEIFMMAAIHAKENDVKIIER